MIYSIEPKFIIDSQPEGVKPSTFKDTNRTPTIESYVQNTEMEMNAYTDAVKFLQLHSPTRDFPSFNRMSSVKLEPIALVEEDVYLDDYDRKNEDDALIDISKPMPRQAIIPSRLSVGSPLKTQTNHVNTDESLQRKLASRLHK